MTYSLHYTSFYVDWGDSLLDLARRYDQDSGMPRPARICVPGIPLHIVQRGNDRQKCFRQRGDYLRYLGCLAKSAKQYDAQVHAYVLMTNHVHLLITPSHNYSASRMMHCNCGWHRGLFLLLVVQRIIRLDFEWCK